MLQIQNSFYSSLFHNIRVISKIKLSIPCETLLLYQMHSHKGIIYQTYIFQLHKKMFILNNLLLNSVTVLLRGWGSSFYQVIFYNKDLQLMVEIVETDIEYLKYLEIKNCKKYFTQ